MPIESVNRVNVAHFTRQYRVEKALEYAFPIGHRSGSPASMRNFTRLFALKARLPDLLPH